MQWKGKEQKCGLGIENIQIGRDHKLNKLTELKLTKQLSDVHSIK